MTLLLLITFYQCLQYASVCNVCICHVCVRLQDAYIVHWDKQILRYIGHVWQANFLIEATPDLTWSDYIRRLQILHFFCLQVCLAERPNFVCKSALPNIHGLSNLSSHSILRRDHPHIVSLQGYFYDAKNIYSVLKYCRRATELNLTLNHGRLFLCLLLKTNINYN